jgi:hypothetical protein
LAGTKCAVAKRRRSFAIGALALAVLRWRRRTPL